MDTTCVNSVVKNFTSCGKEYQRLYLKYFNIIMEEKIAYWVRLYLNLIKKTF